jgi:hypothetical protein
VIEDGALRDFNGTLEEYDAATAAPPPEPQPRPPVREKAAPARTQAQSREALEDAIHEREAALNGLGDQINKASAGGELQRLAELGEEFEGLQREVEQLMAEWAELQ